MGALPSSLDDITRRHDPESPVAGPAPAYLFRASSPGLRDWSLSAGIDAQFVGISSDPLSAVAELSACCHASAGLVIDEVCEDGRDWGRWTLLPFPDTRLAPSGHRLRAGVDWAGAIRLESECGIDLPMLRRRFAALMAPLSIASLFGRPEAVRLRLEREVLPPGSPRFTFVGGGYLPSRGLYRLGGQADFQMMLAALDAAAGTLAGGDAGPALDLWAAADECTVGLGWPA